MQLDLNISKILDTEAGNPQDTEAGEPKDLDAGADNPVEVCVEVQTTRANSESSSLFESDAFSISITKPWSVVSVNSQSTDLTHVTVEGRPSDQSNTAHSEPEIRDAPACDDAGEARELARTIQTISQLQVKSELSAPRDRSSHSLDSVEQDLSHSSATNGSFSNPT